MDVSTGLETAWRAASTLARYIGAHRSYDVLKHLTRYHRIQGSREIAEAAESLESLLIEKAPDIVETELFSYSGKVGPDWLPLPVRWDINSAWVEVSGRVYTFEQHPTIVAAHSPSTDGIVEGVLVEPEDPFDPQSYSDPEKIYLIKSTHRLAYKIAAERGVAGVVLTRNTGKGEAFPYIGLFLTPEEAQKYSTPAVTLPWNLSRKALGSTIRFKIDADLGGPGKVPVVVAWIGDKKGKGPLIMAHYCHPRPGANDNASGVASAIEAFIGLAEVIDRGLLSQPEPTLRLLLIPEYMGTVLSMEGWLSGIADVSVNLDMVGAASWTGVAPTAIYYPPVTAPDHRLADIEWWISQLMGLGFELRYYMYGSDHDVMLAYGYESEIINQWPDPYYHSDMDDADKIDPENLRRAALLAASSVYLYAIGVELPSAAGIMATKIISEHLRNGDSTASRLSTYYVPLAYGERPLSRPPAEWKPKPSLDKIRFLNGRKMLLGIYDSLYKRSPDLAVKAAKLVESDPSLRSLLYGELAFSINRGLPTAALYTLAASVYGYRSIGSLEEFIGILAEGGVVG